MTNGCPDGRIYANGYSNSKWAGEVLLREANDLCGLPVSVFRCDMILVDAGFPVQRIPDYDAWLRRFETAMRALPERQRQYSLLPLLHNYRRPAVPIQGSSPRPTGSGPPCRTRKSGRTRTFRTSARR